MTDISISLWLPGTEFVDANSDAGSHAGSPTGADDWLDHHPEAGGTLRCSSKLLTSPGYVPILECSVVRRLLEVLPLSFGYDPVGRCDIDVNASGVGETATAISMTLPDVTASLDGASTLRLRHRGRAARRRANLALANAGVGRVSMRAERGGGYRFTASTKVPTALGVSEAKLVESALITHVREIFGGDFPINHARLQPPPGLRHSATAARRYNGRIGEGNHRLSADEIQTPWGALTFSQLNLLVGGVYYDTLWPALFFQNQQLIRESVASSHPRPESHSVGQIVEMAMRSPACRQPSAWRVGNYDAHLLAALEYTLDRGWRHQQDLHNLTNLLPADRHCGRIFATWSRRAHDEGHRAARQCRRGGMLRGRSSLP